MTWCWCTHRWLLKCFFVWLDNVSALSSFIFLCIALSYRVWWYVTMLCLILRYPVLYSNILHCTALYCPLLLYLSLPYATPPSSSSQHSLHPTLFYHYQRHTIRTGQVAHTNGKQQNITWKCNFSIWQSRVSWLSVPGHRRIQVPSSHQFCVL